MGMKGQTLVFEQVLLFSLGVVILITSFALFIMYQNFYLSKTTQDQVTQVKEYVLSHIVELCGAEANSSAVLPIPETIGNKFYRINISNSGLEVALEPDGASDFSTLYGLNETFSFFGRVVSERGKIVIYKTGNSIIIQ